MSNENKGRTLYDLLHILSGKNLFWLLLVMVLIFAGGWATAHFVAKPGAPVSIWSLFEYTKAEKLSQKSKVSSPDSPKSGKDDIEVPPTSLVPSTTVDYPINSNIANTVGRAKEVNEKSQQRMDDKKENRLFFDKENHLIWAFPDIGPCSWDRANEYTKKYQINDYVGWRLPSINEAMLFIKKRKLKNFAIESDFYWTNREKTNLANIFHPYNGEVQEVSKSSINFVMLIRNYLKSNGGE